MYLTATARLRERPKRLTKPGKISRQILRTVNLQIPGSGPGRGATQAGFGRFCALVLLRNSALLLNPVDRSG